MYPSASTDINGNPLLRETGYRIQFKPGQLPPVGSFWSLTLYGLDTNLVAIPINRYAIGDRTPDIKTDPEGGLTIHIQDSAPEQAKWDNWLPSPQSGPFYLILRLYLPEKAATERTWTPPPIEPVRR